MHSYLGYAASRESQLGAIMDRMPATSKRIQISTADKNSIPQRRKDKTLLSEALRHCEPTLHSKQSFEKYKMLLHNDKSYFY
jgi:hypothetical protein